MIDIPIAKAHNRLSALLKKIQNNPVTLTRRGKPVGVLLSPEEYERLRHFEAYSQVVSLLLTLRESGVMRRSISQLARGAGGRNDHRCQRAFERVLSMRFSHRHRRYCVNTRGKEHLKAPALIVLYELSNAIWQAERRGRITGAQADNPAGRFRAGTGAGRGTGARACPWRGSSISALMMHCLPHIRRNAGRENDHRLMRSCLTP